MKRNADDLRRQPLVKRKVALKKLIKPSPCLRLADVYPDGEQLLAAAAELGLEGIVSKKRDGTYVSGKCLSWLKVKTAVWREGE